MGEKEIKNKGGQCLSILVEESNQNKGVAIIMHGLGEDKNLPLLKKVSKTFTELGYSTVRFDTTCSIGKSEGLFQDALITNYYKDLESVIGWAKTQNFNMENLILVGHSTGGLCTSIFASKHPSMIKAVIPISTVVSGNLSVNELPKELLSNWEKEKTIKWKDIGKLKWDFILDARKHDVLQNTKSLTMPFLIISGNKDSDTPIKHHKLLYEKLPGKKEIVIIKDGNHNLDGKIKKVQEHIKNWITT